MYNDETSGDHDVEDYDEYVDSSDDDGWEPSNRMLLFVIMLVGSMVLAKVEDGLFAQVLWGLSSFAALFLVASEIYLDIRHYFKSRRDDE